MFTVLFKEIHPGARHSATETREFTAYFPIACQRPRGLKHKIIIWIWIATISQLSFLQIDYLQKRLQLKEHN